MNEQTETATPPVTVRQEVPPLEPSPGPGPDVAGPPADLPGIFATIGALPPGALITEAGLAKLLGKCNASIKAAVHRGELPFPVRLMGKNTWTAGAIVRHHENRLEAIAKKFAKLRPSA
jgi:hypothetical protein